MNANELADLLADSNDPDIRRAVAMLRQQQNEIEDLINAHRFVQNFAEEQHQRAVALESELDRAVELYTDKAIENEALKKSHIELERGIVKDLNQRQRNEPVAWMSNGKEFYVQKNYCPDFIPLYTHPVKEQDESFDRTASHMAGEYVSHPVKEQDTDCQYCKQGCIRCDARKQLTDEEIGQLKGEWYRGNYASFYDLVRAILRKAQEK